MQNYEGAPPKGVPEMEEAAKGAVEGGLGGDGKREVLVEGS